jgi:hypothetical protein
LKFFVREQLIYLLAIIIKCSWLELEETEKNSLLLFFQHLIDSEDYQKILLIQLIQAIIQEFTIQKASFIGCSLQQHIQSRLSFETTFLEHFLHLDLHLIQRLLSHKEFTQDHKLLMESCFQVLERILEWTFNLTIIDFETSSTLHEELYKPPIEWSSILLSESFNSLILNSLKVSPQSTSILICLASLQGPIFQPSQHLKTFIEFVLQLIEWFSLQIK